MVGRGGMKLSRVRVQEHDKATLLCWGMLDLTGPPAQKDKLQVR